MSNSNSGNNDIIAGFINPATEPSDEEKVLKNRERYKLVAISPSNFHQLQFYDTVEKKTVWGTYVDVSQHSRLKIFVPNI